MNINNIDIKQLYQLPKLAKLGLCFGLMIIVIALGYQFLVSNTLNKIDRTIREAKELETRLNFKQHQLKQVAMSEVDMAKLKAKLVLLQKQLPNKSEIPSLVDAIAKAASKAGLSVDVIKPEKPEQFDLYQRLPIKMKITGKFTQITAFLERIASNDRVVSVSQYLLKPFDDKQNEVLSMSLILNTYIFKARLPRPAASQ